ncbi:hypothetical protein [Amycolatopsis sp. DSM 110486]|uniref:hypothetical protein n=1 Tax=Amycolatopsis sp. DSM 110486 TaxID=2865832 RepID=UPI001C696748|nr:hypothetical protein [Amycolatopsis sp. DSM 110486]QYN26658.1 hypothetical protein K1T34_49085 [Amycolatopsis sp. DSM 110486]
MTTNIDIGIGSATPLDVARAVRSWTELPVAVSGGFSAIDSGVFASRDWDIVIIGRSVADAVDPPRPRGTSSNWAAGRVIAITRRVGSGLRHGAGTPGRRRGGRKHRRVLASWRCRRGSRCCTRS